MQSATRIAVKDISHEQTSWYHVTTLSNFVRGYDKYKRQYSKAAIGESTFPEQFFLLRKDELPIGITKAQKLLDKLGLDGDRLIALQTHAPEDALRNDHASGVAQYLPQNYIDLDCVYYIEQDQSGQPVLEETQTEDVVAASFETINETLIPWDKLTPRSVSVLPIAMACQASCRFCFSKASASSDFERFISNWDRVTQTLSAAKEAGAQRAVITGGGEPTLLKPAQLERLIGTCAASFNKVVMITNAHLLGRMDEEKRAQTLQSWNDAGLSVLAISRHHHETPFNSFIMGLDTKTEDVLGTLRARKSELKNMTPRFVCVLQQGGISIAEDIGDYLDWAAEQGVTQVNFKELYVSTGSESAYADRAANDYSARHQVPLSIVYDFAARNGWEEVAQLPWGAPIFQGARGGVKMQIAAYTEPSVYWERTNGTARSWNLMSDGTVLASLEDPQSMVLKR